MPEKRREGESGDQGARGAGGAASAAARGESHWLSLWVDPEVRAALRALARRARRSISGMGEILLREAFAARGTPIPDEEDERGDG